MDRHPTPLTDRLDRGPLLLDGALATALFARGLDRDVPGDLWNVERPQEVGEVHDSHRLAGSQVLQTNTFRSNALALDALGCRGRAVEFNQRGAAIALECAAQSPSPKRPLVAGNIGPSGKRMQSGGSRQEWTDAFAQQAEALAAAGVDYLGLETFTELEEARVALEAARGATQLEVSVSLAPTGSDGDLLLIGGGTLTECLGVLDAEGATALGLNCCTGAEMLTALPHCLKATERPFFLRPNAGLPVEEADALIYPDDPEAFASHLAAAIQLGAAGVGGCCGTDARHTRALRQAIG
ncbi:MAG: homocysteine S-methyltransferase family protein [bacterium]